MNVEPPVFRNSCSSQTDIGIPPGVPQYEAANYLSAYTHEGEPRGHSSEDTVHSETVIHEILNFLLCRTLWISDPDLYQATAETTSRGTQTVLRYNHRTRSIMMDSEIQTTLRCEPKCSTSQLLVQYKETKSFVQNCLRECLEGIQSRIIIDELLDEMIMNGADRLKYPACDQASQTVASYEIKERDVLRRLRIPLVIDPLEAAIVLGPLMDNLLRFACEEVSRNARRVVEDILDASMRQAVLVGFKLAKIREQLRR